MHRNQLLEISPQPFNKVHKILPKIKNPALRQSAG